MATPDGPAAHPGLNNNAASMPDNTVSANTTKSNVDSDAHADLLESMNQLSLSRDVPEPQHHAPLSTTTGPQYDAAPAIFASGSPEPMDATPETQFLNQASVSTLNSRSLSAAGSQPPKSPNKAVNASPSFDRLAIKPSLEKPDALGARSPRSPSGRKLSYGNLPSPTTPTLLRKASMNSLKSANGVPPSPSLTRRRSSQHLSPTLRKSHSKETIEEASTPVLTEASIASQHFAAELESLHGPSARVESNALVLIHDNCYGHRFERLNSTKGNLATIVERPERLQASVRGVAMAYVRLGERHQDGSVQINPQQDFSKLPVPFRIQKSNRRLPLTAPAVVNVHGSKWMDELKLMCDMAHSKLEVGAVEIERPRMDRGSRSSTPDSFHLGDLYLCGESLAAFESALGAVCEAVDAVCLASSPIKRAFVAVRPPGHHCCAEWPQGFCWLNNVQVGIMHGFMNHGLTHAVILDFDLHHGDGSQAITWDHNSRSHKLKKTNAARWKKTSIAYYSIHDINSYPCEMGDPEKVRNASVCVENAHNQNIWNVHLKYWDTEAEFDADYKSKYLVLLDKARDYLRNEARKLRAEGQEPRAAIFISAGFDASEHEGSGMQRHPAKVPTYFYAKLTEDVVRLASEEGLAVDGRVVSVLEGGYSDRALCSGVFSHVSGLVATDVRSKETTADAGQQGITYDRAWWATQELNRLDSAIMPALSPTDDSTPRYSSPTTSSTNKALPRRSFSSTSGPGFASSLSRPPSPPMPEVHWSTATQELSKLLIPSDRPVNSITWEELKLRKDRRASVLNETIKHELGPNDTPAIRRGTRDRKPVRNSTVAEESSKGRRRTVAGTAILASDKPNASVPPTPSRRLSSSNILLVHDEDAERAPFAEDILAKKARPSTARKDSAKSVTAKTKKPTKIAYPKIEPGETNGATSRGGKQGSPVRSPRKGKSNLPSRETSVAPSTATSESGTELGNITNAVKKIKINVLTKEIKDARAKAEREKSMTPTSETAPHLASSTPKVEQLDIFDDNSCPPVPTHFSTPGQATTPEPSPTYHENFKANMPSSPSLGYAESSVVSTPNHAHTATPMPANHMDIFIPYQPEGTTPKMVPQPGPVRWLPANTVDTPMNMRRGHAFTATSAIPFAPAQGTLFKGKSPVKIEEDVDMGDLPTTPTHHSQS
ncbi:histone deacetylase domain-containing protein [Xylariales sp. PMI_506]|nr:histone deacetylase domain-containing protein [Xylariales sp. PMI_506]